MHLGTFKRLSIGSDRHSILQSPTEQNAFLNIYQETFFTNLMATTTVHQKAKSFRDAMQREDAQEWAEELN
jgi:hypothetical protein